MTTKTKLVVNCETGEQSIVEMTPEEIAVLEEQAVFAQKMYEEEQAAKQAKAEAKASALAKLAALGLTEEEANALIS